MLRSFASQLHLPIDFFLLNIISNSCIRKLDTTIFHIHIMHSKGIHTMMPCIRWCLCDELSHERNIPIQHTHVTIPDDFSPCVLLLVGWVVPGDLPVPNVFLCLFVEGQEDYGPAQHYHKYGKTPPTKNTKHES